MSTRTIPAASAATIPGIPVDDRLCLALHTAARAMDAVYRPLLQDLDLSYPQFLVMSLLWEQDARRIGELSQRIAVDPSTMSPLLRRLQARDLVVRRRDPEDERAVLVELTDAGRAMQAAARDVPDRVCIATGIPVSAQAELVANLHALASRLVHSSRD